MKLFYILLLIVGILLALFGMYVIYQGSIELIGYRGAYENNVMTAFEYQRIYYIIVGVCISIVGLLISLFGYGRIKTIKK